MYVAHKDFQIKETVFKDYENDFICRNKEVSAKPNVLLEKFFVKEFTMRFVPSSNNYISTRKRSRSDLYCWEDSKK